MSKKEFSPTFIWWLLSILLASGIGSGLSSCIFTHIDQVSRSEAKLKIVEAQIFQYTDSTYKKPVISGDTNTDSAYEKLRIIIKNEGDKRGIITAVLIDGHRYDSFSASHVVGLKEKQKFQYEYVPAGYCPGNNFSEVQIRNPAKDINKIVLEIEDQKSVEFNFSVKKDQ